MFDLNAAWELFLSRKRFADVHYRTVVNSITGDTTYTLLDDKGNATNAVFTVKNLDETIKFVEWEDSYLYIYYN